MSSNLTLSLRTASSGLLTNQAALDTVAQNISNVNTEGYSRKIANFEHRTVNGAGAGVEIGQITRNVDEGLLKTLRIELSAKNTLDAKSTYYQRIQDTFGAPADNSSISHLMQNMLSTLEQLAQSPEKALEQSEVVRLGNETSLKLQDMSSLIQDLRLQADQEINAAVTEINQLLGTIQSVNNQVVKSEIVNRDTTALKDERDVAVTRLSELIDVRYYIRDDGDMVVFSATGQTLVDASPRTINFETAGYVSATSTHAEGNLSGVYIGDVADANDISDTITDGRIKGLLELRDTLLPNLQSQIDQFAATLRDTFNQIHNRGVAYPGLSEMTGSRSFLDVTDPANTANQTITLDPAGGADDVAIALFDESGNQQAATTLDTIMTSGVYGSGTQATHGPWSLSEVMGTVEDWLQANGAPSATVALNSSGQMDISLNSLTLNLAFRDQVATADGSTQADASIGFDADGDGTVDETVSGFSNFFGLNDFFVDDLEGNTYETAVLPSAYATSSASEIRFVDGTSDMPLDPGGTGDVTLTINAGDSLQDIADNINGNIDNVYASVIPDGAGQRLRITHATGENLNITAVSGTFLTDVEVATSNTGAATTLSVRSDINLSPNLISRGNVQWDSALGVAGEYYLSSGDNTAVSEMADLFLNQQTFDTAGGISGINLTFTEYSSSILSLNSSKAADNEMRLEYKTSLTDSLKFKSDSISGVNLDEEMSNLIIYEQAYSAAARVMSVVQNMLDALENTIR